MKKTHGEKVRERLKRLRAMRAFYEKRAFDEEFPERQRVAPLADYKALDWAIRILMYLQKEGLIRPADYLSMPDGRWEPTPGSDADAVRRLRQLAAGMGGYKDMPEGAERDTLRSQHVALEWAIARIENQRLLDMGSE